MFPSHTTWKHLFMVEPVAVLIPHAQVAQVRKVDRKPTLRDEDKDNDKERNAEREEKRFTQNKSFGHKGTICDILL